MSLSLDPQTEQRIQQEAARGPYADPADLLNHALDLISADRHFTPEERARFDEFLDERMAEYTRGEGIPGDKAREILAARRAERAA